MWLFTQNGFTSVVQHKDNPQLLVARFRTEEDAQNFGKRLNLRPIYTQDHDYHWRVIVSRVKFRKLISMMIADIDYTNFKGRIHNQGNSRRDKAYAEVWADMYAFQDDSENEQIKLKFYRKRHGKRTAT